MANLVARLTIKNRALLTQRQNATVCRSLNRNLSGYSAKFQPKYARHLLLVGGCLASVAAFIKLRSINNTASAATVKRINLRDESDIENVKLTARERRFIKFASVEFDNQLYMTPQDFLDSVVEQEPRPRLKRRLLSNEEVDKYKDNTPALKKGSTRLFRNLRDKGIISYTEYLFLLSILTKPKSGFRIAFNMFDTDGNQRVDKAEFLVIVSILAGALKDMHNVDAQTKAILTRLVSYEERSQIKRTMAPQPGLSEYVNDGEGLQRRHVVPTTLQLHFFGKRGTGVINYDNFYRFMDNLQTEVLELEFHEFSKGNSVISELDFAKILLRYTYLATDEYDVFLERLLQRVREEKGISFNDFRDFCHFLNNLDDFTIAMRMYTLADRAISKDEFGRAAKICTGYSLSQHLIDTVFAIFDADGDGLLSYKEFIAIMKDRLHRGFKQDAEIIAMRLKKVTEASAQAQSVAKSEGWEAFKYCLRNEMKSAKKSANC
ncbi:calcium uptake protein 3, mitochondrial isoform X7 [Drosophila busckii]|uniref:calcium uptake protein 3, mitochondrial isoform X7 n=1 Tax=Drosophila busckii TaxID=30019 RepID=UPI00083EFDAF|nr:calcium uptake protein 3, mitochondrial isoform X7 [Drosophila busckii]